MSKLPLLSITILLGLFSTGCKPTISPKKSDTNIKGTLDKGVGRSLGIYTHTPPSSPDGHNPTKSAGGEKHSYSASAAHKSGDSARHTPSASQGGHDPAPSAKHVGVDSKDHSVADSQRGHNPYVTETHRPGPSSDSIPETDVTGHSKIASIEHQKAGSPKHQPVPSQQGHDPAATTGYCNVKPKPSGCPPY